MPVFNIKYQYKHCAARGILPLSVEITAPDIDLAIGYFYAVPDHRQAQLLYADTMLTSDGVKLVWSAEDLNNKQVSQS